MTRLPASLMDPEAIARTLLPFGASRGLPREAYDSADVLRWELRHLFDQVAPCGLVYINTENALHPHDRHDICRRGFRPSLHRGCPGCRLRPDR